MNDYDHNRIDYNSSMNAAENFIGSFLSFHDEKIKKMIDDAVKYLDHTGSQKLIRSFEKFKNEFDALAFENDALAFENDELDQNEEYVREKECEVFHIMIINIHQIFLEFLGSFTGSIQFYNGKDNISDVNKFNVLIIHLRSVDKFKRNNNTMLIMNEIKKICCKGKIHKDRDGPLLIPYTNVFSMVRTLRNYEAHKSDQVTTFKIRNSSKEKKIDKYVLDPITKGESFGNRFSIIGSLIMLTYQIIEILEIWNNTFSDKNFESMGKKS